MEIATDQTENLTVSNVARRLRVGILFLVIALGFAAWLEEAGASRSQRLWLFIPFALASNAFFQAISRTCWLTAWRGVRCTPDGDERVYNAEQLRATRTRGLHQALGALLTAIVLTAIFVIVG